MINSGRVLASGKSKDLIKNDVVKEYIWETRSNYEQTKSDDNYFSKEGTISTNKASYQTATIKFL